MLQVINQKAILKYFEKADIEINGSRAWDIQVNDKKFYQKLTLKHSLGLGESYMDLGWTSKDLEETLFRLHQYDQQQHHFSFLKSYQHVISTFINRQSKSRASMVNKGHYDIGNFLFEKMLGPSMVYTCGKWKSAQNLEQAQEMKMKLVCEKLHLEKDMSLLDIGCGFGSFAKYATDNYHVNVTGVTLSEQQIQYAQKYQQTSKTQFSLSDYRELSGQYDRIASI